MYLVRTACQGNTCPWWRATPWVLGDCTGSGHPIHIGALLSNQPGQLGPCHMVGCQEDNKGQREKMSRWQGKEWGWQQPQEKEDDGRGVQGEQKSALVATTIYHNTKAYAWRFISYNTGIFMKGISFQFLVSLIHLNAGQLISCRRISKVHFIKEPTDFNGNFILIS